MIGWFIEFSKNESCTFTHLKSKSTHYIYTVLEDNPEGITELWIYPVSEQSAFGETEDTYVCNIDCSGNEYYTQYFDGDSFYTFVDEKISELP